MKPLDYRRDPHFEPTSEVPEAVEVFDIIDDHTYVPFGVGRIIGKVRTFMGKLSVVEVTDIKDGLPYTALEKIDVLIENISKDTLEVFSCEDLCPINSIRRHLVNRAKGEDISGRKIINE